MKKHTSDVKLRREQLSNKIWLCLQRYGNICWNVNFSHCSDKTFVSLATSACYTIPFDVWFFLPHPCVWTCSMTFGCSYDLYFGGEHCKCCSIPLCNAECPPKWSHLTAFVEFFQQEWTDKREKTNSTRLVDNLIKVYGCFVMVEQKIF